MNEIIIEMNYCKEFKEDLITTKLLKSDLNLEYDYFNSWVIEDLKKKFINLPNKIIVKHLGGGSFNIKLFFNNVNDFNVFSKKNSQYL